MGRNPIIAINHSWCTLIENKIFYPIDTVVHFDINILPKLIEAEWRIYASVKLTIIGSDNGLSPGRCQAIIWTNAGLLLIGPLGTNFSEMLIEIHTFSFKKIHLKMSSGKWRPFCLGLNVLKVCEIFLWRYGHFITQFFVVTLTYAGIYASFYWNRSLAPLTLKAQQ